MDGDLIKQVQNILEDAKGVFMDRKAMVDHAIALKAWAVPSVPSLASFPLEYLEYLQAVQTAEADREDAAKDLAEALEKRAEQASACHEGAPRSTASATAALQASEGQPLLPAALWLSARLPAGWPPCLWQAPQL